MEMLGSPHLMLANFRRDDRVTALRRLVKRSNGPLRQAFLAALAKIQRSPRTPAFDPAPPFGLVRLLVALALPERDHAGHDTAPIPQTGRAPCRGSLCQSGSIPAVAVTFTKK